MDYMRKDLEDKYKIKDFQNKLLNIMMDIDNFCNEHNIDYCLMAGSALGAERHHGFIPWDDDMDIYMTENDYNEFRTEFLNSNLKNKYYLQEWGKNNYKGRNHITMAKIRLNGSMIYEETYENWNIHKGICIDIFILHKASNNTLKQKMQYLWAECVVLKGLQVRKYKCESLKKKIMLAICKIIPKAWILKHGLKNIYKYESEDTDFYHGFIDTRNFSRAIFKKDIFFPTRYVDFANVKLKVPAKNDEYLRIQFGQDYMVLPPENKRPINKHTDGCKIDSKIIYDDLSDEKNLI